MAERPLCKRGERGRDAFRRNKPFGAGEVRAVAQAERRIAECSRLGFKSVLLPKANLRSIRNNYGVELCGVDTIAEAMAALGLFAN